jgi:hypothetical protein
VVAKPRTGELLMGCKMADECIEDCPGALEDEGMVDGSRGWVAWRPTIQNFDKSEVGLPRSNY